MPLWLLRLYEACRFIQRYRNRLSEERRLEREHQALLLKTFLTSLETIQETTQKESSENAKAMIEIAKAISAQAMGFGEWMKCFQSNGNPTTSVVREADEYREEQERLVAAGFPADIAALPEEFRLAWVLKHDPNDPKET